MEYKGSNQLYNVYNQGTGLISNSSAHFQDYSKDQTLREYSYNANGAMASDLNKGISSIAYNSLNLPTKLTIDNISKGGKARGTIEYTYSASGVKLRTIHTDNAVIAKNAPILTAGVFAGSTAVKTTDYVGNKIYEDGKLKQILIDGGYIKGGKYYYYLTDHLGNNRAVADSRGEIIQKTHYYPFGMAFADSEGENEQRFKYNGKELDRALQLNTYDYAARYMDPAIGRFTSIDPLAEKYYSWSPYTYCLNNPLRFIDMDGRAPGDVFKTRNAAAKDWGNYYNGASIVRNVELKSFIYKTAKGYVYGEAVEGSSGRVNAVPEDGKEIAADIHSHSAYEQSSDNNFSTTDKWNGFEAKRVKYVTTPNGSLKKYTPPKEQSKYHLDENVSTIATDLPRDPKDPSNKDNKKAPIDIPKNREEQKKKTEEELKGTYRGTHGGGSTQNP